MIACFNDVHYGDHLCYDKCRQLYPIRINEMKELIKQCKDENTIEKLYREISILEIFQ